MNSNLSAILSLHAELSLVLILLVALLADLFMAAIASVGFIRSFAC